ncbi:T9SS type A sorting domain-containing protein [Polaribacter sp. M15]
MENNYILKALLIFFISSTGLFCQVNVTLKVDMSGVTINPEGIHVVGSINNWNTTSTPLTQEGSSDIYSTKIQLDAGWHEYKFLNGNSWGTEENAGYPCAPSNGNRFLYINDSGVDVVLEVVPFNGCNADGTGFSLTLNVDMTSEILSSDGVRIAGWFNGWNGDNFIMPNIDNNIHSATLRLPTPTDYPISFEYKYINGSDWETPDESCATVVNTNRTETIASSGKNIFNVFNGCNYTLSVKNNLLQKIGIYYQKDHGIKIITPGNLTNFEVQIFDISGRQVSKNNFVNIQSNDQFIKITSLNQGIYYVQLKNNEATVSKKMLIK